MIKTEQQRRWWFATHPELSWGRAGGGARGYGGGNRESSGVPPKDVDAYADEALKYETGTTAELIKALKFWFGTEFESKTAEEQHALLWGDDDSTTEDDKRGEETLKRSSEESTGHPAANRDTYDQYEDVLDRTRPGDLEALEWNERIRQQDSMRLEPDPHTYLDVGPYRRFLTSPIEAFKDLLRSKARDAILDIKEKDGTRTQPRLPPKGTPERAEIDAARSRGIRAKQAEELGHIRAGGKGSGVWSEKELQRIRQTGKFPDDVEWHHDPTVANRPDLASDPKVVTPLRGGRAGHLRDGHDGNWRNPRE
jgi:hypothetical protein